MIHASACYQSEDLRDDRPLTYSGKICTPGAADEQSRTFWRKSALFNVGRTELARQVPGKEMRQVENISDTSLPSTTDGDGTVKGAYKYCQLGADACQKLLQALLEPWKHCT